MIGELSDWADCDLEFDLLRKVIENPGQWERNEDAYMSIGNVRDGVAHKLIALMRSGEEIHPIVRKAIAQALEDGLTNAKTDQIKLVVKGDGQRTHGAKIAKRQQYVEVAQYYESLMAMSHLSSEDALEKTVSKFGAPFDVATVSSSITYYRNMVKATGHISDPDMRAVAEHQFHLTDIDPNWREKFGL